MHVCVIGAGIIGLSTAYILQQAGHQVTVVDRAAQPASGASGGNGAQLSYAYVQPLAEPGIWKQLPKLLLAKDSPLKFRLQADPQQWSWGLQFLGACNASTSAASTQTLLTLAAESRQVFEAMLAREALACDHHTPGKLVLYPTQEALDNAARQVTLQAQLGGPEQQVVNAATVAQLEPALGQYAPRMAGAIHTPSESTVDCRKLCEQLAQLLAQRGARFCWSTTVDGYEVQGGAITALHSSQGRITADHFVLASGWESAAQARRLGLQLPVYPLKGYSITVDAAQTPAAAPQISVTDSTRKVVFARIGQRLRVAGMVEIVGRDQQLDASKIASLQQSTREVFPDLPQGGDVQPWTGMRPATPTGLPITGRQRGGPANLWLQTGHGALGLTLAFGSAQRLVQQMEKAST
ncbi:D-amino acid dehydrogenase [Comamonas sp. GB3 AK4-5]|uniref:D-amino acid dehydrogenase n=1 Tax=Comamonas sp. GB3 AK4-5 TaxID=3231487 RepID=UPI00351ED901